MQREWLRAHDDRARDARIIDLDYRPFAGHDDAVATGRYFLETNSGFGGQRRDDRLAVLVDEGTVVTADESSPRMITDPPRMPT